MSPPATQHTPLSPRSWMVGPPGAPRGPVGRYSPTGTQRVRGCSPHQRAMASANTISSWAPPGHRRFRVAALLILTRKSRTPAARCRHVAAWPRCATGRSGGTAAPCPPAESWRRAVAARFPGASSTPPVMVMPTGLPACLEEHIEDRSPHARMINRQRAIVG